MAGWKIETRDADLGLVGLVDDFVKVEAIARFNKIGAWTLELDAGSSAAADLVAGAGVVVSYDAVPFLSGPVVGRQRKRTADTDAVEVFGVDDSVWLARRLAFPEAPALTTATSEFDERTGVASTVMRGYVNDNAGPAADATRRVTELTLEAVDPLVGSSVTYSARFESLDVLMAALALAGGDLGFTIVQVENSLQFRVYDPQDLTATAVFSFELGNLLEQEYREDAPAANYVLVGGGGDGVARTFVNGSDDTSIDTWGRIEGFTDHSGTTDPVELGQVRDARLLGDAAKTALSVVPVDTEGLAYGDGYGLGDRVTVVVDDVAVQDVVREVKLTLSPDGTRVTPTIGTPGEAQVGVPRMFSRLAALEEQVHDLQRRR